MAQRVQTCTAIPKINHVSQTSIDKFYTVTLVAAIVVTCLVEPAMCSQKKEFDRALKITSYSLASSYEPVYACVHGYEMDNQTVQTGQQFNLTNRTGDSQLPGHRIQFIHPMRFSLQMF